MTSMAADRTKAGQELSTGKEGAKSEDEKKREQVSARLQKVFDATKKDVEDILTGLDKKVDDKFSAGEKAARDAFTAEHKRKIKEYKHKRYSGFWGPARWIRDLFAGLPKEANQVFVEARQGYVNRMQDVISGVADMIGAELGRAKQRIAKGRNELQAEVKKLPADLRAIGKEAAGEFAGKFDELTEQVNDKGTELVDTLASKYTEALKAVDEEIAAEKEKNKGLIAKIVGVIKAVIVTIVKFAELLLRVLAKAAQAVGAIIKDPIGFLGRLVSGVGAGLRAFMANIANHLKKGLVSWLLGAAAKAGLQLPERFDIKGILALIASMLGLTWAFIRSRVVAKGVPEQAMSAVESTVPEAQKIKSEGIGGVWEQLKDKVGDLKETLLGKIAEYLIPTVIIAGITWIISLLNPASAFIKACKAIIGIVTFIVDHSAQIIAFVNAVLDAVIAIASGGAGGVPGLIETALAGAIPLLIGFLAALLGISGLADKVRKLIQSLAKPVRKAVDWIVNKIAAFGKKIWARLKTRFGKDKKRDGTGRDGASKDKTAVLKAASAEARSRLAAGTEAAQMPAVLCQVHKKYAGQGLTALRVVRTGSHAFRVDAHGSPHQSSEEVFLDSPNAAKGDPEALKWSEEEVRIWKKAVENLDQVTDDSRAELKALLDGKAEESKKARREDQPTVARGVLTWKLVDREDVIVRKHRSAEDREVYNRVHGVKDAHAEEHVTLFFQKVDLPTMPARPELIEKISVRYEVNRSPCVNCANYIADFVRKDLAAKSATVHASVAASSLYQGQHDFTGEIRQRYPKIFAELVKKNAIVSHKELQEARKAGGKKANLPRRFTPYPKGKATTAEVKRRHKEWEKTVLTERDYRGEWFRIRRGHEAGTAGLAILKAHGIGVAVLDARSLDIRDPHSTDPDRALTPAEQASMTEEEKDARRTFLENLKRTNSLLQQKIDQVNSKVDDTWVVDHGYVGGRGLRV